MIRFRAHHKHQVSLGYSLVMSEPQFMKGLSIEACNPQLPNHRHCHQDMDICICRWVAEELQEPYKLEGSWEPLCSQVVWCCCSCLDLLLQNVFRVSVQVIGHSKAVLVEIKEEIWEVANGLQNHSSYMGICHFIRPGGTSPHSSKAAVPIMLSRYQLVATIVVQVFIQSAGLLTRQMFHGGGDVSTISHEFEIMRGLA